MTTIANWLESMPAEMAAASIRQFSNDGQMEMAVNLLHKMEQRNAAKILAALEDAVLFSQIAKRYRELDTNNTSATEAQK